jgi:hypothetical protein
MNYTRLKHIPVNYVPVSYMSLSHMPVNDVKAMIKYFI